MQMYMECATASLVHVQVVRFVQYRYVRVLVWSMCEGPVCTTPECGSASLLNVKVVWLLLHRDVRVLVWSMCEWSGHKVRVR